MRMNWAFIVVLRLPGLGGLGCHARSSFAALTFWGNAKTDQTLWVGRLH